MIACAEKQPVPAIPSDPEIEGKIEKLLKNLTLEEKIGQMCELTIGVITDKSGQKLSEDLLDTVNYISKVLKNEEAAMRLINDVETAILARLNNPVAFEPYHSRKKREYPYYRIYVRNYVIYYVVIDDVMEVRRLLYGARNIENLLN